MADHENIGSNKPKRQPWNGPRRKTAGEVRFIKDRGGDEKQWGWGSPGPTNREITGEFKFDAQNLKPLAKVLRSSLSSMGHALAAYDAFTRIKSAQISPDGALGGKGYIQKIADMRRQYMNIAEALSSLSDTLYDEMHAPHWDPATEGQDPRERDQVKTIMNDVEEIRDDPEEWAEEAEEEMSAGGADADGADADGGGGSGKQARRKTAGRVSRRENLAAIRVAARYLARSN